MSVAEEKAKNINAITNTIYKPHNLKIYDVRFTDHTRKAVLDMKQDILQWLK